MFESPTLKLLQAENAALRGQVSDLHSRIHTIHSQWSEERKQLIDRIMALTHPTAVREIAHASGVPSTPALPGAATPDQPVRRNWPQGVPDSRPMLTLRQKEAQLAATATSIEEASALEREA